MHDFTTGGFLVGLLVILRSPIYYVRRNSLNLIGESLYILDSYSCDYTGVTCSAGFELEDKFEKLNKNGIKIDSWNLFNSTACLVLYFLELMKFVSIFNQNFTLEMTMQTCFICWPLLGIFLYTLINYLLKNLGESAKSLFEYQPVHWKHNL